MRRAAGAGGSAHGDRSRGQEARGRPGSAALGLRWWLAFCGGLGPSLAVFFDMAVGALIRDPAQVPQFTAILIRASVRGMRRGWARVSSGIGSSPGVRGWPGVREPRPRSLKRNSGLVAGHQDQRHHRARGLGRRAGQALRRPGRGRRQPGGLRGLRAAEADRRPHDLARHHPLARRGVVPGVGQLPGVRPRPPGRRPAGAATAARCRCRASCGRTRCRPARPASG